MRTMGTMRSGGWLLGSIIGLNLAGSSLCAAADAAASRQTLPVQLIKLAQAPTQSSAPVPTAAPLISLLLPLDAPDFLPAATAVQQGCDAALALATPRPRWEIVRTNADPAVVREAWNGAAGRGAAVIVGPLTRAEVTALSASLMKSPPDFSNGSPSTISLNSVDGLAASILPARFYSFGLPLETEARAVANLAWGANARTVIIVQSKSPLSRRSGAAFAAEWSARGGRIARIEPFEAASDKSAGLEAMRERFAMENFSESMRDRPDAIFLAADAAEARIARPYLGNTLPVYATSQINDGRRDNVADLDLGGIHFMDMPWLLQPDHPAVMVYPRQPADTRLELQRLYALGIDACRLALAFADERSTDRFATDKADTDRRITLDGVTGTLSVATGNRDRGRSPATNRMVEREPLAAVFVSGAGIAVEGINSEGSAGGSSDARRP